MKVGRGGAVGHGALGRARDLGAWAKAGGCGFTQSRGIEGSCKLGEELGTCVK